MLLKVVCLVVFLCVVEEAVASCIQYGHACWGGHGKRGGNLAGVGEKEESVGLRPQWFLSRLIKPADVVTLLEEETEEEQQNGNANQAKTDDFYKQFQTRQQSINH